MKFSRCILLVAFGLALYAIGVQAQAGQAGITPSTSGGGAVTQLSEWSYAPIYGAQRIRAKHLLNIEVFGAEGEAIGNVEDVIISHGAIAAIIAEVGGFWDIGGVHIAVPWAQVTVVADGLAVPVREDNVEQYALSHETSYLNPDYLQAVQKADAARAQGAAVDAQCARAGVAEAEARDKSLPAARCTWRLTALIDDYVTLEGGADYGLLEDVFFSKNGKIQAIVVEWAASAYGYGAYAFPFDGYAAGRNWNPHDRTYVLPYSLDQVSALEPFHYDRLNGVWF